MSIVLGIQLASQAGIAILAAIGSIFGNSAGALGIGGIPLAIGVLSVGLQLKEAQAEGSYAAFVRMSLLQALQRPSAGRFGACWCLVRLQPITQPPAWREHNRCCKRPDRLYALHARGHAFWDIIRGKFPEDIMSFGEWKHWQQTSELPRDGAPQASVVVTAVTSSLDSGFGRLLDAIYKAEGGAGARVPYGMTGFADAGNNLARMPTSGCLWNCLRA